MYNYVYKNVGVALLHTGCRVFKKFSFKQVFKKNTKTITFDESLCIHMFTSQQRQERIVNNIILFSKKHERRGMILLIWSN